ncbi:hypothetical protein EON65_09875 [archaeon]|nr:MAG: hypothetical protein EON65_09875 [archaeon]
MISGKALLEANKYMDSLLYVDEKGNFKVPHELSVASPASKESSTKPKDAIISKRRVRPADEEDLTSPTDASKNKARKLIQS